MIAQTPWKLSQKKKILDEKWNMIQASVNYFLFNKINRGYIQQVLI